MVTAGSAPSPATSRSTPRIGEATMIVAAFFFYLFACICVASAVMVIASRNPVHSVLWVMLAFVNAAGLFMMLGAEFLALILIVVYVGAVAVLFLFVIMMLDIDVTEITHGMLQYLPFGLLIGGIVLVELLLVIGSWTIGGGHGDRPGADRAGTGEQSMIIGLGHYLTVGALLFTLGIAGIFLNRKNVIIILMSIELILLAVNINLVAFSSFLGDIVGQVYALFVLTVAASEAAIGLAILVVFYSNRRLVAGA